MDNEEKTLRLIMPQWQGGNNISYHFGAQLLAWLAPVSDDETIEVPISTDPTNDKKRGWNCSQKSNYATDPFSFNYSPESKS